MLLTRANIYRSWLPLQAQLNVFRFWMATLHSVAFFQHFECSPFLLIIRHLSRLQLLSAIFSFLVTPLAGSDVFMYYCFIETLLDFCCVTDYDKHTGVNNPNWASLIVKLVKNLPTKQGTWVWPLGLEDPLEKEMATHSSVHAWRIPRAEEPGGLQSMGSQELDMTVSKPPNHYLIVPKGQDSGFRLAKSFA